MGDTRMKRAMLADCSRTRKPFFLGFAQHAELVVFAQPRAPSHPRLLVLTGPARSGKTAVLRDVLPALIAQEHSRSGLPEEQPFIVNFTFSIKSSAALAAQQLECGLRDALAGLGVRIRVHNDAKQALQQLPITIEQAARAVRERGRSLWLLLDQCEVRPSHARSSSLLCSGRVPSCVPAATFTLRARCDATVLTQATSRAFLPDMTP